MPKERYDPKCIEKKWQKYWEENKTFAAEEDPSRPKYYVLDMFPYPSGSGLHVGHVTGYAGTDVIARYKRQKGFNVLHPIGWDSFGLPAEQYAIRTGTHPQITTEKNINTYRRQLKALGFSYDWSREFATSDAHYYKWTQWLFTKLYEQDLAYEAEVTVNFCPHLGTVLANEEVEDGKSIEGGYPVERRPLRQWMLKITSYAEKLLNDLEDLDWPDHLKKLQRNWIGRSEGVDIDFAIDGSSQRLTCYTTRQDTIFGASFAVIAPEHPLVGELTKKEFKEAVSRYVEESVNKSDLQRTDLAKEKTGVFTGSYLLNPLTGAKMPIWIADYILMSYGTGAVMAVPAHDERDEEFAKKYDLPIVSVIDDDGKYVNSSSEDLSLEGKNIQEAKDAVADYLERRGIGKRKVNYKLRDWLFSRQRYWGEPFPILHFEDGSKRVLELDELPLTPPMIEDYKPSEDGSSPLSKVRTWVQVEDAKTGKKAYRETNTMPQWAGSCWYYLRFCDPHNDNEPWSKEKESYWLPVDLYVGGVEHAVLHLLYARFWHKVFYDIGLVSTKEPFQAICNQGLVTSKAYKLESGGYIHREDVEEREGQLYQVGGSKKVFEQIEKMSKSKFNGVSPDEMIEEYGADALRLYELFMTPFDKEKLWQTDAVSGCKRFLTRVFDLMNSDKKVEKDSPEALKLIHRLVKGVEEDFETLSFNTAIAKMMEFLNAFSSLSAYPISALKAFAQLIYPFAPHFGEECWERLGEKGGITYAPFPKYEEKYLQDETVTVVIQVMGKVRGKGEFRKGVTKDEVLTFAKEQENVAKFLRGEISKVIFVPDKLMNLVVQ